MTQQVIPPGRISPILTGPGANSEELYASIKPVRYRYVMAYLHDDGAHKAGEVMAIMPMTSVTYGVGLYAGTEMSGNVHLPDFYLDQMPHPPLNDYTRFPHPDQQGIPLGSMFECGNRAIYIMRNDKVVWGGILWTRSYTSGTPSLTITGLSFDGYVYYRALRQSVVFSASTNVYTIWYAVLMQALTDFTWKGTNGQYANSGRINDGKRTGASIPWTGLQHDRGVTSANARNFTEAWPNNAPKIEMPGLPGSSSGKFLWKRGSPTPVEVKTTEKDMFRGYDMKKVGEALQEWSDTETIASSANPQNKSRFEYRVLCWYDTAQQIFRQRYTFGEMTYGTDPNVPTGVGSEFIGKNTKTMVDSVDNKLVFDYPGHISEWTLHESMEEAATRVIMISNEDAALKHAEYAMQTDLLNVPNSGGGVTQGSKGWRLFDKIQTTDVKTPSTLKSRAGTILKLLHVPQAQQISDLGTAPATGQRTSERSTELSVTLYQEPTVPFPDFGVGDWATFAIEDPFYGGVMYLQRRIIGYTVQVVPDHESDYSHETYQLELTDETRIEMA